LSDNAPYVLDSRGLVGLKRRHFEGAWADYDAALKAEPGKASYLYGRGIAAIGLGRAAEGAEDLANAVKLDADVAKSFAGFGVSP
jgi:tetratricopeptide (TPR) repeat protein